MQAIGGASSSDSSRSWSLAGGSGGVACRAMQWWGGMAGYKLIAVLKTTLKTGYEPQIAEHQCCSHLGHRADTCHMIV